MRERRYLSFDMNNPRHRAALAMFDSQPARERSEFAIDSMLRTDGEQDLKELIQKTITETLSNAKMQAVELLPQPVESIGELPDELSSFLE